VFLGEDQVFETQLIPQDCIVRGNRRKTPRCIVLVRREKRGGGRDVDVLV